MTGEDLTVAEAAVELGVPRQHVLNWLTRKKLTGRKRGWNWFIPVKEIKRFKKELAKGPLIYYVYLHRLPTTQVFYVGRSADPKRAYEVDTNRNNPEYAAVLKNIEPAKVTVEIVKVGMSNHDSWMMEQELIGRFRAEGHPITNQVPLK